MAPLGFDEAIERGRLYRKEGADVVFVEAPQSEDELREIPKKIDAPLLANMIENGVTPTFSADELKSMGYSMVVFPLSGLYGAAYAMKKIFSQLKRTGSTKGSKHMMLDFNEFNDLVETQIHANGKEVSKPKMIQDNNNGSIQTSIDQISLFYIAF